MSLQRQSSGGGQALARARSASPPPGSLGGSFSAAGLIDGRKGQKREARSASFDNAEGGKSGPLPPGAEKIMEMGFSERKARAALEKSGGDASQAVELLLAQPPSPAGKGDTDGEDRPPSPSTMSPPSRKSLSKKTKAAKPQNPVFHQEAFTPILIPAKPGAIVVSPQQPWTAPSGGGGGGAVGMARAIPVTMTPNSVGLGLGPGPGPGPALGAGPALGQGPGPVQGVGLIRPRSTPDVISALDPDSVDSFEPQGPPPPKPNGQQQQPPLQQQQQQAQAALQGSPGQGIPRYRRASAPTGMLPGDTSLAVPGIAPGGPQPLQSQSQAPTSAPAPLPLPQQQQTRPSNLGLGPNPNARRPPAPSVGAAVGGATARGPARTPVPAGRASVGGSAGIGGMLPAGVAGLVGGAPTPSLSQSQTVVSGQGQASPQFGRGMIPQQQQQQQLQGMPTMSAQGGMSAMPAQG
ncbi:unnamed protein product, partial [Laminaria digitata]